MRERAEAVYAEALAGLSTCRARGPRSRRSAASHREPLRAMAADAAGRPERPRTRGEGNRMNAQPSRGDFRQPAPRRSPGEAEPPAPQPADRACCRSRWRSVGGYMWVTGGRYVSTEDAYVKQDRVTVMPQVSGQIATVSVAENQPVKAGARSSPSTTSSYRATVAEDEARLQSARLDVAEAQGRVRAGGLGGLHRARRAGHRPDPGRPDPVAAQVRGRRPVGCRRERARAAARQGRGFRGRQPGAERAIRN